ncbi:ribonuclease P protein component [Candidatus Pelagibacter sp.]|nr:ribonuclease P protein component [Candidatus Pelagibacter sp.]
MRSKILALSKNEEFKNLLKQRKISNKYVTIFFGKLINKNKDKLNISFVTKKKIGNAVKRNKIKRRLKNIVNDVVKKVSLKFDYSYLVIAKPTMLNNEYTIIKETLFRDLERIHK